MELMEAKVQLKWKNGRVVDMGTMKFTSEKKGTVLKTNVRIFRQRIGLEFVRMGFRLMFMGRKCVTEYGGAEDHTSED